MIIKRLGTAVGMLVISTQLANANFQKGHEASDQNGAPVIEQWRADASHGDVQAQFELGQTFEKGTESVSSDLVEAYAWFKLAAAQDFAGADEAIQRLRDIMTPEEISEAEARSVATLGIWYRQFTGQDEGAFQEAKAAKTLLKQQQESETQSAADIRAETQRAMIEHRNAEAEAALKLIEDSRKAAILAAQQQAEEAKRNAELRQHKIDQQQQQAAQNEDQRQQQKLEMARARLEELKARQDGGNQVPTTATNIASAPAVAGSTTSSAKAPAVKGLPEQSKVAAQPQAIGDVKQAALDVPPPVKPGGADIALQDPELTEKKISLASKEPSALRELDDMKGLDKKAVVEIFETAKTAELDSQAAKSEIADSLVRIDALKWSLISGAKGDKSAPMMNRVLMSKMTPVQIAEANRLAGEWLIDRQSRL